jgi:hypothetical protein
VWGAVLSETGRSLHPSVGQSQTNAGIVPTRLRPARKFLSRSSGLTNKCATEVGHVDLAQPVRFSQARGCVRMSWREYTLAKNRRLRSGSFVIILAVSNGYVGPAAAMHWLREMPRIISPPHWSSRHWIDRGGPDAHHGARRAGPAQKALARFGRCAGWRLAFLRAESLQSGPEGLITAVKFRSAALRCWHRDGRCSH